MSLLGLETAVNILSGMNAPAAVRLGDVVFDRSEVPGQLSVGSAQTMTMHKLPGGGRVIDLGGDDPSSLSLDGTFLGAKALSRAKQIDAIRIKGKPVTLTVAQQQWRVIVRSFSYTYTKMGLTIPYHLLVEVCVDPSSATGTSLSSLSSSAHTGVLSALGSVTQALSGVSSLVGNFTGAAQGVLGQVTPIANIVGLGKPLSSAQTSLSTVAGLASAGQNLANMPQALQNTISGIKDASTNLTLAGTQASANIDNISDGTVSSRVTTMQNVAASLGAVEGKAAASVALQNAQRIAQ